MEEQEVRNFLRSEGEQLTETPIPTIDINERLLSDIADEIESEGLDHVINNLGTIANTFRTEHYTCSGDVLAEALKVIHTALVRLHMEVTASQGNVKGSMQNVDRQTRHRYRKYLAVLFFLIHKAFEEIERSVAAESHDISIQMAAKDTGKRRKKQPEVVDESKFKFWFKWRPRIIDQLWKVVVPPFNEIWENNANPDGYNFFRCLTLALCTTIKNTSKRLKYMDDELENIFDILGVLASYHDEDTGIIPRLIPLLKGSEETAKIVASGIDRMVQLSPDKSVNLTLQALTEAYNIYTTRFDKESGQERGFHTFLTQLCELQPKGALHSLPVILQFLDAESHLVRNAVLITANQLMSWTWGKMNEEQDPNDEEAGERRKDDWIKTRATLLNEILLKYMKDTNSLVRSKGINLLADLVKNRTVMPVEAVSLMRHVKLRLLDKTVTTRKAATSLVVDLVKTFPHCVRPVAEFERKREQKLGEICAIITNDANNPAVALYFIIREFFLHIDLYGFTPSSAIKEKVTTPDEALAFIEELLKEGKYWQACEVLYLSIRKWTEQVEQIIVALKRNEDDTPDHLYIRFFKATYSDIFPQPMESLDLHELNYIAPNKVKEIRDLLVFTQACMKMQVELEKCQPSLRKLLELGTTTDKKEAVMFFAAICEAGYVPPHAITASIINAISQLNAEELPDFVEPFKNIFIGRDNLGPVGVAKKIIELIHTLSEGLVESLSGMIGELYRSRVLNQESVLVLWDAFCLAAGGCWNADSSRSAAYILGIIGQIERKVITTNLNKLIEVGLGQRGLEDYELAKVTLQTILFGCRAEADVVEPAMTTGKGRKAAPKVVRKGSVEEIQFPPNHELFPKIIDLIENGLKVEGDWRMNLMYPRVVELSMQIIYRMCTNPGEIVAKFLPNIHGLLFAAFAAMSIPQSQVPPQTQVGSQEVPGTQPAEVKAFQMSEKLMYRYMSFGKALLGAHIMYYEQIVSKEIKNRKLLKDKANKSKNKGSNRERQRLSNANGNGSLSINSSVMNQSNADAAAAEMDAMIGNIGFDAEADNIKTYVAKLLDSGFFRQFRVHVFFLCQNFGEIKSLNLKVAVAQALTKLMSVCEASVIKSVDLLIKLWAGDQPFPVKLEILKGSIRLTVKFPNQMEKVNDSFSAGLAHKDARVRKACMDYIQYLALSDLLKVREQLSDTAACLCDENFELREMARDFINQIAEKDNVLQNSIPDIISRLSGREDIPQENFQAIMKTLLTKIKKEKQLGGLVERIVGRFKGPVKVRVCQDTAFCLTQIQQNDKTLKILRDNLNHYGDKLGDDFVYDAFMDILQTFKKQNKPELKMRLEEWEKDLDDLRNKCVAANNAEELAKKKGKKPERRRMEHVSSSEEEEENNENGEDEANNANGEGEAAGSQENGRPEPAERSRRNSRRVPRKSSSSANEDEENEEPQPGTSKRNGRPAPTPSHRSSTRVVRKSSEDDDEEPQPGTSKKHARPTPAPRGSRRAVRKPSSSEDEDEQDEAPANSKHARPAPAPRGSRRAARKSSSSEDEDEQPQPANSKKNSRPAPEPARRGRRVIRQASSSEDEEAETVQVKRDIKEEVEPMDQDESNESSEDEEMPSEEDDD